MRPFKLSPHLLCAPHISLWLYRYHRARDNTP